MEYAIFVHKADLAEIGRSLRIGRAAENCHKTFPAEYLRRLLKTGTPPDTGRLIYTPLQFQQPTIGKSQRNPRLGPRACPNPQTPLRGRTDSPGSIRRTRSCAGARLVDVRTRAELDWVGRVPGAVEIEWNLYPGGMRNDSFLPSSSTQSTPRPRFSSCAAAARAPTRRPERQVQPVIPASNILEGFGGDKDAAGQRNKVGGWRHAGLPWVQS